MVSKLHWHQRIGYFYIHRHNHTSTCSLSLTCIVARRTRVYTKTEVSDIEEGGGARETLVLGRASAGSTWGGTTETLSILWPVRPLRAAFYTLTEQKYTAIIKHNLRERKCNRSVRWYEHILSTTPWTSFFLSFTTWALILWKRMAWSINMWKKVAGSHEEENVTTVL